MITERIDSELLKMAEDSDRELKEIYEKIDRVSFVNSDRILSSFIDNNVSYTDFAEINGYGNYDTGRDKLEKIFATVLGTEDSLVRSQIMSGTNALYLAFSGLLKHGDTMISLTGTPYDSLQEMIGIYGDSS
ncbi:MAG: methionine gamma-lyase family protein, partial [Erysipelotrichaceae bacterium]|nr:methionine gamma-lyase family protein [Erysipelotrichaceae bacterium]